MTTETENPETSYAPTGGSGGPFATVFLYAASAEVEVRIVDADGVESLLTAGEDYLIEAISGDSLANGGNVTLTSVPGDTWDGQRVVITRATPASQPSEFDDSAAFQPSAAEVALDKSARVAQDLAAGLARALRVPYGEAGLALASAAARAGKLLEFDEAGAPATTRSLDDLVQAALTALGVPLGLTGFKVWPGDGDPREGGYEDAEEGDWALQGDDSPPVLWGPLTGGEWPERRYSMTGWTVIEDDGEVGGGGGGGDGGGDDGGGTGETPTVGLVGAWYADQVEDGGLIAYLPNSVNPSPTPLETYVNNPRGSFSRNPWRVRTNVTVADYAGTAPDGSQRASTVVGTGSSALGRDVTVDGEVTLAVSVRRRPTVSVDQHFQLRVGSSVSGDLVATNAWQRFTLTATIAGPAATQFYIRDLAGASYQLEICDFYIFDGDTDLAGLTPPERGSHLFLGEQSTDSAYVSVTDNVLDLSVANLSSFIQFPAAISFGEITISMLVEKVADTQTHPELLKSAAGRLITYMDFGDNPLRWQFASDLGGLPPQPQDGVRLEGAGMHLVTFRYDGTNMDTFIDDAHWIRRVRAGLAADDIRDWVLGNCDHKLQALHIWDEAKTNAEIRSHYAAVKARAAALTPAVTLDAFDKVVFCEGTSITQPYLAEGLPAYPSLIGEDCTPNVQVAAWAISGSTLADLNSRASALDAAIPLALGSRKYILTVEVGANDGAYVGGAAQFIADLEDYCDARRAAGWKVIVLTLLPRTTTTGSGVVDTAFNSFRATVNAAITAGDNFGGHADAVADQASNAAIGANGACLDAAKYVDGVHPTAAGQVIQAGFVTDAVDSL